MSRRVDLNLGRGRRLARTARTVRAVRWRGSHAGDARGAVRRAGGAGSGRAAGPGRRAGAGRDRRRGRDLLVRALAEAAAGRLRPVIGQTYPLADAAKAHEAIESRTVTAKTLLIP
ncbi:MAG: zinc-binding dehydrogenase [Streptosporangiales bacterium]|nr:zinc-binding dehydrogenase [Streptosporangiales bacterium]